ncbi:MAG: DHH family phosphoesterase, partial [Candidatus Dojkabacteria bacterium]|nr:DHH family phosphoesterase [Candidatus Dojkabacteria bacterium]
DKIVEACSILIITHDHPDGDAYGSALGLKNFLSYYFPEKEIDVFINSKENKNRFAFMPGYNDVIYRNSECYENILNKSYDVIFCLDLGKISRIKDENIINLVMRNLDKTIYLDHHDTSEKVFCMFYLNYKTVSSTSELVAGYFIKNIFGDCEINKDAALCFYVGIVTDTGKFSYNKTSKFTHIISS